MMDEHFASAPLERNLPVLLGLVGVWNRNFLADAESRSAAIRSAVAPSASVPATARNGEQRQARVTRDGQEVEYQTGAVLWGEPGSNAQHSFFQLLHQGTADVALDLLAPLQSSSGFPDQQNLRGLANCFAQAQAFTLAGQDETAGASGSLAARAVPSGPDSPSSYHTRYTRAKSSERHPAVPAARSRSRSEG